MICGQATRAEQVYDQTTVPSSRKFGEWEQVKEEDGEYMIMAETRENEGECHGAAVVAATLRYVQTAWGMPGHSGVERQYSMCDGGIKPSSDISCCCCNQ